MADPGSEWEEVPLCAGPTEDARSIGLADLCIGLRTGTPHRCSGELAQHVREVLAALERSAAERTQVAIESRPDRPDPIATASK